MLLAFQKCGDWVVGIHLGVGLKSCTFVIVSQDYRCVSHEMGKTDLSAMNEVDFREILSVLHLFIQAETSQWNLGVFFFMRFLGKLQVSQSRFQKEKGPPPPFFPPLLGFMCNWVVGCMYFLIFY